MKKVVIDNRNKVVMVEVPRLLLTIIRGAVGKHFVVKRYKGRKIVVTKFPDMSRVVASEKQKERRDLFKEAVVYAKWIVADEERKKAFRKTLPRRKQMKVYQAAIQLYMSKQGDKQWLRKQLAVQGMMISGKREMTDPKVVPGKWLMVNEYRLRESDEGRGAWMMLRQKRIDKCFEAVEDLKVEEGLIALLI